MMIKGSRMDFLIKLKGEFCGYYAGLYRQDGQSYVGCVDVINDKKVKRCKKKETAERLIEEIKGSASFEKRFGNENIICEIVEVEE
jgi:hypothetical protein